MKQALLNYKNQLLEQFNDKEKVYQLYIAKAFEMSSDVWEISEAFSYYNEDNRVRINKDKQLRKRVALSDMHIATQFFTPRWLAEYIIDNSLGRFFPQLDKQFCDGELAFSLNYHENLKLLDPAVGTGNMLLCAYDLLEKAYKIQNIEKNKIPYLILPKLYGLDIDKRATDIAKKLLLKRAGIKHFDFNIYTFSKVSDFLLNQIKKHQYIKLYGLLVTLNETIELGSIIKTYQGIEADVQWALKYAKSSSDIETLLALQTISRQYDVVVMNPPYLTSSDYNPVLKDYIYTHYSEYKQDLFAVFIAKYLKLLLPQGFLGVVCPYNWMFIKSFTNLRKLVCKEKYIYNLVQLASGGYAKAVVYLSAFIVGNNKAENGYYIRLNDFKRHQQASLTRKAINEDVDYRYIVNQQIFENLPNHCMMYWLSNTCLNNFKYNRLSEYLEIRQGMATGDNKKFLRKISQVDKEEIAFNAIDIKDFDEKNKKYALYNKGGTFRKWFGNINYVIQFDKASRALLAKQGNRMPSSQYYFRECITWTLVSSKGHFGARYSNNSVFDVGGSCGFIKDNSPVSLFVILGFLCSKVANNYLNALNPTLNMQVGDIKNLPLIIPNSLEVEEIEQLVKDNIDISRKDWYNIKEKNSFNRLKQNEERLNQIFIRLYGLKDILNERIDDKLITVRRDNEE